MGTHHHLVGYARVSTLDQSPELQLDALRKAGCKKVFVETISSAKDVRPQLAAALEYLRPGDTLVVWKLDRLARSMKQLIETVDKLKAEGIGFRSLTEAIDTTSAAGELFFHIFGALAQFERSIIRERTNAGIRAALARGRQGGTAAEAAGQGHSGCSHTPAGSGDLGQGGRQAGRPQCLDPLSACARSAQPRRGPRLMPIKRELRFLYPIDWRELSAVIRFERAQSRCERCRRPHGEEVLHLGDGRWWDAASSTWRNGYGRPLRKLPPPQLWNDGLLCTRVVLACAHLDHDPTNNHPRNLAALCQRCHMVHDRDEHRRRRSLTFARRRASGDLFLGPYPAW